MAATRRSAQAHAHAQRYQTQASSYVYGNVVYQPNHIPEHVEERPVRPEHKRRANPRVNHNRRKALSITKGYAIFLTIACILTVAICVMYLSLQFTITTRSSRISNLRSQLAELTEANDSAYNALIDSVNLEQVRQHAIHELGLIHISYANVVEFERPNNDHVVIHYSIPRGGVLARTQSRGLD